MRILRVAQNLYPEVPGGGTYHVHAMSRDQAAMGHDVTVLTVTNDDSLPRREQRDGYKVIRRKPTIDLLGNEISVGVAQFLRDADDFDVVHAHSHLYFSTNLAAVTRRLGDTPLAITNHGLYSQNAPEWLFDLYLRTVGRWTFNQADVMFCYTEEDRERVQEFGVESRIEVVPNGVDTERFTPDGEASDLIDHDGLVVLFVGRLVQGKRPEDAIEAVDRLPDSLDAKLYVVGDGPLRADLEGRGDDVEVEYLGHVPYDKMPAIYRGGNVMILPSRAEGLPRTVLEAFASGTPVVSSHLEHTASIVQGGGETVPVGDIKGYTEALEQVLENGLALGNRGRQTVVDKFQWQETVEETTAVLNSLR
ncbi:glycosyltransferase family 4 protein [Halobacterium sp. KA-6]|uniref:glycosyltransferase family 4 protein n=1 Tax=Halobacterium sp. KA-6 TaxID=2896368 RepID=UPI001E3794EC|nr:glycosyltransferase family 4 protein [Halobacterium sp. KA-6]MCD2204881.1 glycosyltransferase family 4 protein [Halobacterium sp. KA-6]